MFCRFQIYFSKKKLRIGYYVTDGFAKPAPAIIRAVEETKQALEKAGHTLVQFNVPRIADAMRIYTSGKYNRKCGELRFFYKTT